MDNDLLGFHVGELLGDNTAQIDAETIDDFLRQIGMRGTAEDFDVGHPSS